MKCKKCGYSCRDINTMRKHYLKKHPGAMKRKSRAERSGGRFNLRATMQRIRDAGYTEREVMNAYYDE